MRLAIKVLLVLALAAGVAGVLAYTYHLGVAQGLAESGKLPAPGAGAPLPYPYPYPYWPYGHFGFFGFGLFRLLGPIFVILLVLALARGAFWRGGGWSCGHGGGVPPRFEEWHRRVHEAPGPKPSA